MQRKPSFPVTNCNIKMPDSSIPEATPFEDDWEPPHRRQQLINFGHSQWGFNNWSWSVSKQDLDFVDYVGGKCTAGVAAFVSVAVKSFDIHRENVGYATAQGNNKGLAIHRARKCAVTNALRETLLSFGGSVATELMELLDTNKVEALNVAPEPLVENNQNIPNRQESKGSPPSKAVRKEPEPNRAAVPAAVKSAVLSAPPVAKAHPMPAGLPQGPRPRAPAPPPPPPLRPNSNEVVSSDISEEEARAERKRRQRLAQEEFRLKQLLKQKSELDEQAQSDGSGLDSLLMAFPTQDIIIEETGTAEEMGKRKSPGNDGGQSKRRGSVANKLNVITN
ncbi:DNA repair protein RAD52 homolog isoform X3 [Battus philenor]|uniref:DNA repair protein RAD52 homolog isoform X3 n=1 Tax=Battus philenor TaxID=42288 RepID=UPI0035D085B8